MLGVFTSLSSLLTLLQAALYYVLHACTQVWRFFETYGWRLVIAFTAAWHLIQRLWLERDRRLKQLSRLQAADPSRVAALDSRRHAAIHNLQQTHQHAVEERRRRDEWLRLQRLHEIERKIVGGGRRLGSE